MNEKYFEEKVKEIEGYLPCIGFDDSRDEVTAILKQIASDLYLEGAEAQRGKCYWPCTNYLSLKNDCGTCSNRITEYKEPGK